MCQLQKRSYKIFHSKLAILYECILNIYFPTYLKRMDVKRLMWTVTLPHLSDLNDKKITSDSARKMMEEMSPVTIIMFIQFLNF